MASELDEDNIDWDAIFCARDTEDADEVVPPDTDSDIEDALSDHNLRDLETDGEESEEEAGPAIQHRRTQNLREDLRLKGKDVAEPIRFVLSVMDEVGIDITIFVDGVSWGTPDCVQDAKIRYARSALLKSKELPSILRRWRKPPRPTGSKDKRPKGAKSTLESFASECCLDILDQELEKIAGLLVSPAGEDIKEEELTSLVFDEMIDKMKKNAPTLWHILRSLAYTSEQEKRNTEKNPDKIVLMIISMLSYTRSHRRARFQKTFAIYLKFRGLSAKGFDTLHALALTMSHKWTGNAVGRISQEAMEEVVRLMQIFPWLISHDNVQIPFRVFSQRLDNQGEFGNGTAATVYIKRNADVLPDTINNALKETRAAGLQNPLTELDILDLANESWPRIEQYQIHQVLQFLLDSPEFDIQTYSGKGSSALDPPKPVHILASGPDSITLQYLLGTVNIPEASYEDNDRLMEEWFKQIGWGDVSEKMNIAMKKVVAWIGDQLTVDRLRGLFKFRAEDENSFERMDWAVFIFGWLHLQMAYGNSLHKQYLGTTVGRGLRHAFELLERKGLTKVLTKGPFHHNLDEALKHVAEAHILEDWLVVSGAKDISELRSHKPEELRELAKKLVKKHASSAALEEMDAKSEEHRDQQKRQLIQWNRDVLQYIVLGGAVSHGNVGLMEDMLPHLLFRFIGGRNTKYATEVLELLQGLHREWPPEVKDFVRNHCWVINTTGKPDMFCPVDQGQEHNIKDIKVTYRSEGPNINWGYLKKLHPAIHVIRRLTLHMEQEFGTLTRGKKHSTPKKVIDVEKLRKAYRISTYHKFQRGRLINSKNDRSPDYATNGCLKLQRGKIMVKWHELRSYKRATTEHWENLLDDEESDNESSDDEPSMR